MAESTRRHIVDAAVETLKTQGFAGATSRAIARTGGFNQALIFYHFGTLDGLLLAALDRTSEERLARYREAIGGAETSEELVQVAVHLHAEDRESGHVLVVAQMLAGSVARPELAPAVLARMDPWLELCETALRKLADAGHVPELVPLRDLAYAIVTFSLGLNLLAALDEDRTRVDGLFARLSALAGSNLA